MANNDEKVEIRLVARADMREVQTTTTALQKVDAGTNKATEALKRYEKQVDRVNAAQRRLAQSAGGGIGSPPGLPPGGSSRSARGATPTPNNPSGETSQETERKSSSLERWMKQLIGYAAVLKTVRSAIHNYVEDERAAASLDAALAQRAQLTDKYRESLTQMAEAMSQRTATQGSDWINVLTTLSKFGADSSNISQAAKAVEDLSGATGGSLAEAATLVGKAMAGSFTGLQRYGFQVDETASQTEKLTSLFEQFAQRGAGQLEARAKTLSGQFATMTNALGNLGSAMTNAAGRSGVVQFWFQQITQAANHWADAIGTTIPKVEDLNNVMGDVASEFSDTADEAERTATSVGKVAKAADAAADAFEREKEAMRDKSNQTIEMIRATAKLREAEIRASGMTDQQKKIALAALNQRAEAAIFNEQNRVSRTAIRLNEATGQDLNANLLRKENSIAEKEAEFDHAVEGEQARRDAARARETADRMKKKFAATNNPTSDNPIFDGPMDFETMQTYSALRGETLTREQYDVALAEQDKQLKQAEAQAQAAEAKAAALGDTGNLRAIKAELDQMKANYKTLLEKYQEQQQRLDDDSRRRTVELQGRGQVFPIEQRAQRINDQASIRSATPAEAGPTPPPVPNQVLDRLFSEWNAAMEARDQAVVNGVQGVADRQNRRIQQIETQLQMLGGRR